jgi:Transposase DDE domain
MVELSGVSQDKDVFANEQEKTRIQRYKVRNWSQYNRALVNRGDVTIWLCDDVIDHWYARSRSGKRGRPTEYNDVAIELCLSLRFIFHLPLRATQGFVTGLIKMLGLTLKTPDFSLLGKRSTVLPIDLRRIPPSRPIDIVVDASGLKVFGEGEWKIRTHGKDKRRTWKKIHLSADPDSHEIIAVELTASGVADCDKLADLLPERDAITTVYGDGAFDNQKSYDSIVGRGALPRIPPRHGAALTKHPSPGMSARNMNIQALWFWGRKLWKEKSGYHRRSLAETTIGRFKSTFGGTLRSRRVARQVTEVRIKAQILNRMTHLGMPDSYRIS